MNTEPSQQHIWSYFQNQRPERAFESSYPRNTTILRKIKRLGASPQSVILNIGIGDGNLERTLHSRGWKIHSIDPDAEAVSVLSEQGIQAQAGFIESLPLADQHFDFVLAAEVLEHLTDTQRQAGLREIRRTLKPSGYLVGTVPYQEDLDLSVAVCPNCRHVFHRWGHTRAFDLAQMRSELAPFFEVISCRKTAFVDFQGRSLSGKLKGLMRLMLAKRGAAIAVPSIFFVARKA